MKTVYEISEEYRIPVRKLLSLQAAGHLAKVTFPDRSPREKIVFTLKKGNPLTVEQLRSLIVEPALLASLEEWKKPVKRLLAQLGDMGDALPAERFPHNLIFDAANKDPAGLEAFSAWIASIIPAGGCSYGYVGIRAVLNVSDVQFPVVYPVLAKAIRNARAHGNLAGMSDIVDRATVFFPRKEFDL